VSGPTRSETGEAGHGFELRSPILRRLIDLSARWPRRVVAVWAALLLVTAPGLLELRFETTASSLLNRVGPDWERYQQSIDEFGGDEVIVVAVEGEGPFDPVVIDEVGRLSEVFEGLSGVRRVDSIHTMPIVRATPEMLVLDPAIDGPAPRSAAEIERIRALLMTDRIAPGTLFSKDGRLFTVNVMVDEGVGDQQAELVQSISNELGDGTGWISGVPIFESGVGARTLRELTLFVPITLLLIIGLLALVFRSALAVAVPLATSISGCWITLAAMGVLEEPITMLAMLLPSVLLALGCAYVMHLLTAVRNVQGTEARVRAIESVATPIALSGLTTAVGFFAMSTVGIDAIRALGAYGGLGTLVTVTAALTLAPALLVMNERSVFSGDLDERVGAFGQQTLLPLLVRRRGAVLACWLALVLATGLGLTRLEIETDGAHWWPNGSTVRDAYETIRSRLSGISPMNVVIRSRDEQRITNPLVLERIDALTAHLNGLAGVGKAISIADPLRQLHGGFSDDVDLPLPDEQPLIEQYLMLLESVEHTQDLVRADRLAANIVIRANNNGSRDLLEVAHAADAWWLSNGVDGFDARTTGIMFEFARAEDAIAWGQIRGLAIALTCIAVVLLLIFRKPATALIALVPNLVPLVVIFGGMGLAGVALDAGTVCLGCLALGIAVDDTIHFLVGYRTARDGGLEPADAISATLGRVLPALAYTTLVIGIGFAVLGLSEFTLTRNLGLVTAGLVGICLVADVTLLPALILLRRPRSAAQPS
jgi:predicted RND superfamily exporter protein